MNVSVGATTAEHREERDAEQCQPRRLGHGLGADRHVVDASCAAGGGRHLRGHAEEHARVALERVDRAEVLRERVRGDTGAAR